MNTLPSFPDTGRLPVTHLSASVCAHLKVNPFDNITWNSEQHFWYDQLWLPKRLENKRSSCLLHLKIKEMKTNILRHNSLIIRDFKPNEIVWLKFCTADILTFLLSSNSVIWGGNMQAQVWLKQFNSGGKKNNKTKLIHLSFNTKPVFGFSSSLVNQYGSFQFNVRYYFQLFILSVMAQKNKIYVLTTVRGIIGGYH